MIFVNPEINNSKRLDRFESYPLLLSVRFIRELDSRFRFATNRPFQLFSVSAFQAKPSLAPDF